MLTLKSSSLLETKFNVSVGVKIFLTAAIARVGRVAGAGTSGVSISPNTDSESASESLSIATSIPSALLSSSDRSPPTLLSLALKFFFSPIVSDRPLDLTFSLIILLAETLIPPPKTLGLSNS